MCESVLNQQDKGQLSFPKTR